jgi:hypothetical protein
MGDWRCVEVCLGSRRRRRSLGKEKRVSKEGSGGEERELTARCRIGLMRP